VKLAKIFIAHSKKDENIKNLFFRAFSGTGVDHILKEYENASPSGTPPGQINRNMAEEIEQDILMSAAVVVILSETVQQLPNTAHWIVYESALAKSKQKPVWVFEPFDSQGSISLTIPYFNHYVRFRMNDQWRKYIHTIVSSYDDKPILATTGGAMGGAWLIGGIPGMILGGVAGYLLSKKTKTPQGFRFTCDGCFVTYEVHLPNGKGDFRCAACNKRWVIT
jgi:hypothetical protein